LTKILQRNLSKMSTFENSSKAHLTPKQNLKIVKLPLKSLKQRSNDFGLIHSLKFPKKNILNEDKEISAMIDHSSFHNQLLLDLFPQDILFMLIIKSSRQFQWNFFQVKAEKDWNQSIEKVKDFLVNTMRRQWCHKTP